MLEGAGRARALPWRMTLERRLEVLRISVEAASVLNESSFRGRRVLCGALGVARCRRGGSIATAISGEREPVSEFEDHAIVLIARALARREGPGSFIGLPRHHMRIMRYMGLSSSSK